jgi:ElaA protein
VVSSPSRRKTGAGKELMQQAIHKCHELFGISPIRIGAQLYLHKFYTELGFEQVSDTYLEDGIPHVEMIHSK